MASIKGTRTEKNLLASFAGESQARGRYTYFASVAKKEGYEQIAAVFLETAEQEKEHAKKFFKFLEGGMVEITSTYPAGIISTTLENLRAAAEGENEEWTVLYPEAAKVAREEGFTEIAVAFEMIARVEAVRLRPQGQESSPEMPCLPASSGLLRAQEGELLVPGTNNSPEQAPEKVSTPSQPSPRGRAWSLRSECARCITFRLPSRRPFLFHNTLFCSALSHLPKVGHFPAFSTHLPKARILRIPAELLYLRHGTLKHLRLTK